MSNKAINALTEAAHIAKCGSGFLTGFIIDKAFRKAGQWRNAEVLATIIIDSVANAFQCENSTTFEKHGYRDMNHAIEGYVSSNMDDWSGKTWTKKDLEAALLRLDQLVKENAAFEQSATLDDLCNAAAEGYPIEASNKVAAPAVDTKAVIAFHSPSVLEAISMVGSTRFTLADIADDFFATLKREGAQVSDEWLAKVRAAIFNHFMIDEVEAALKF